MLPNICDGRFARKLQCAIMPLDDLSALSSDWIERHGVEAKQPADELILVRFIGKMLANLSQVKKCSSHLQRPSRSTFYTFIFGDPWFGSVTPTPSEIKTGRRATLTTDARAETEGGDSRRGGGKITKTKD